MYNSAKQLHRVLSSVEIRKTFIDYFVINHEHKFVRSSPVVPFCDPTVAFVNAGMNQFKSIFLGKTQPRYKRVANSQKCVRVGGKHNDLGVVGQDGYHHTFFEMLGNWSFGDYFKREACEMAIELLRGPYNIDPNRLYVTYFAGDKVLGLPADMECFEIWRSLGFPAERILPFDSVDNFWEMGSTGPCGPCTEIHIDHCPDYAGGNHNRAGLVNAGRPDLTELWNLVFIQYNRNEDGSISKLPAQHVDTGMGFERLTAILQNKSSNYDTDLFSPIFDAIQKASKAPHYAGLFPTAANDASLDTAYRILADHSRMITACLSDGMLPDQNQKLRRILRKAFTVSENVFGNEQLLSQLIPVVVESLGSAYPEMYARHNSILELIAHEQEVFKAVRASSSKAFREVLNQYPNLSNIDLVEHPGFVPAFRDYQIQKPNFENNTIPGKFLFKLTDTYGLTEESFQKLAELENMNCDLKGYHEEMKNAKQRSKQTFNNSSDSNSSSPNQQTPSEEALTNMTKKLTATKDQFKYNYKYNSQAKNYEIQQLDAKILGLLFNNQEMTEIDVKALSQSSQSTSGRHLIAIVTDKSNFYYESGGQQSDLGKIVIKLKDKENNSKPVELDVVNVRFLNDCVVHVCAIPSTDLPTTVSSIKCGDVITLEIDADHRKQNTLHHTATHLLNSAIRTLFNKVTYQVSSQVTRDYCKLEVGLIGRKLTKDDVEQIEQLIARIIGSATPIITQTVDAADVLQENNITLVPGEIYPETGLRLVNISCDSLEFLSKELCCGTHATNTQELEYFCITNMKLTNRARYAFSAVAGNTAEKILKSAAFIKHRVDVLEEQLKSGKLTNATEIELQKIRNNILHTDLILPYAMKVDILARIQDMLKCIKETARTTVNEFIEVEMRNLLQEKPITKHPFLIHYIKSSALMEEVPLQRATKVCTDRPILVLGLCDGNVRARCCVPKKHISENFNAEKWLKEFADAFGAPIFTPKGQDPAKVSNMKNKRLTKQQYEERFEAAMLKANDFAKKHVT